MLQILENIIVFLEISLIFFIQNKLIFLRNATTTSLHNKT